MANLSYSRGASIDRRVLGAKDMRGVVIVSSTASADGGGAIPGMLLGSPRDDAGNLIMLGTGQQRWSTVHVADLAQACRRVLEDDSAHCYYVVGNGSNPALAELGVAAAVAVRAPVCSPRFCCSTRAPKRPGLEPSSVGARSVRLWSMSFARELPTGIQPVALTFDRRAVGGL